MFSVVRHFRLPLALVVRVRSFAVEYEQMAVETEEPATAATYRQYAGSPSRGTSGAGNRTAAAPMR